MGIRTIAPPLDLGLYRVAGWEAADRALREALDTAECLIRDSGMRSGLAYRRAVVPVLRQLGSRFGIGDGDTEAICRGHLHRFAMEYDDEF